MKNQYKSVLYFSLLLFSIYVSRENACAQTYATPELKAKAEKDGAEKTSRLGIVPSKENTKTESTKKAPAFDYNLLKGFYRLQKVEAIDQSGKHSPGEMQKFSEEAQREFNTYDRAVNMDSYVLYTIRRDNTANYSKMDLDPEGKYLLQKNCKACSNQFEVIENTSSRLVLEVNPQDNGQYFKYRLTFIK